MSRLARVHGRSLDLYSRTALRCSKNFLVYICARRSAHDHFLTSIVTLIVTLTFRLSHENFVIVNRALYIQSLHESFHVMPSYQQQKITASDATDDEFGDLILAAPFLRTQLMLVVAFISCSAVISGVDGVCVEWDQQTCPSCLCCPTECRSGYFNNGVTGCTEYFEEGLSWQQPLESCSSSVADVMKEVHGRAKLLTEMVYVFVARTIECRAMSASRAPQDLQTGQGTIQGDLILSAICATRPVHLRTAALATAQTR